MSVPRTPARPALVLVATASHWLARALASALGSSDWGVVRATTGEEALSLIRTVQPDAIILSRDLPDIDALEVCRRLRQDPRLAPANPILLVQEAAATRADRVAALQAGAWELYSPPLDAEILLLQLAAFVRPGLELKSQREDHTV